MSPAEEDLSITLLCNVMHNSRKLIYTLSREVALWKKNKKYKGEKIKQYKDDKMI